MCVTASTVWLSIKLLLLIAASREITETAAAGVYVRVCDWCRQGSKLYFHLPPQEISLSVMFERMELAKSQLNILEYALSQTTLEQVCFADGQWHITSLLPLATSRECFQHLVYNYRSTTGTSVRLLLICDCAYCLHRVTMLCQPRYLHFLSFFTWMRFALADFQSLCCCSRRRARRCAWHGCCHRSEAWIERVLFCSSWWKWRPTAGPLFISASWRGASNPNAIKKLGHLGVCRSSWQCHFS